MSEAQVLLVDDAEGVRTLTFNRPDALNAFNQELWYATADALDQAAVDDAIRCVLITGTGRAFTAGQDLGEMADPSVFADQEPGYNRFMPALESFPKPVVAAVNGVGVGIGLTLLLHCDLVLMSDTARIKVPFISLGVTTEASASVMMPTVMGWQRAAEVLFTEPWITADQAVADGIALRAVPHDRLMEDATALARHVGALPLEPVMATKQLMLAGRLDAVRAARLRETAAFEVLVSAMLNS
ncbi:MAG TPA: enoyl-CoA hydratase-related protein [Microthrixaceae bacterium]|jgi:enoyl-CoA hydratase/carnithine racemase|nr:enoyl-CoA hydratase-related protein [Microthrixaceae bacterium]